MRRKWNQKCRGEYCPISAGKQFCPRCEFRIKVAVSKPRTPLKEDADI